MKPPVPSQQIGKVAAFDQERTGLVTLLFTDIVGSTEFKQQIGEFTSIPAHG